MGDLCPLPVSPPYHQPGHAFHVPPSFLRPPAPQTLTTTRSGLVVTPAPPPPLPPGPLPPRIPGQALILAASPPKQARLCAISLQLPPPPFNSAMLRLHHSKVTLFSAFNAERQALQSLQKMAYTNFAVGVHCLRDGLM